jgi:hypothetical protein
VDFATIQAAVSTRLNNERFWTADDIQVAINMAYLEVCEYTECYETETTLTLLPDLTYYDLETDLGFVAGSARMSIDEFGNIDATFDAKKRMRWATVGFALEAQSPYTSILIPLRVWNNQTSRWLDITTVSILDRERPRWGATGGEPDRWFHRGFSTMGIYPKPLTGGSTTSTLLIRHSAVPIIMAGDGDVPEIPVQYQEVLELGALCHLKGLEREPKTAVAAWKEYTAKREELFDYVKDRMKRDHIQTYGGSQVASRR